MEEIKEEWSKETKHRRKNGGKKGRIEKRKEEWRK